MSERDTYPHGVPCWVEALVRRPRAATASTARSSAGSSSGPGKMPGEPSSDRYFVARLRGRDVAGVGSAPPRAPRPPRGSPTSARDSADATAEADARAGGTVVVEPFDVPPVGPDGGARRSDRRAVLRLGGGRPRGRPARERAERLVDERPPHPRPELAPRTSTARCSGGSPSPVGPITMFRRPGYVGGEPEQPVPRDVVATMFPGDGARALAAGLLDRRRGPRGSDRGRARRPRGRAARGGPGRAVQVRRRGRPLRRGVLADSSWSRREMKIVVNNHISIDGVMQAPGGPEEDLRGGFRHGRWASAAGQDPDILEAMSTGFAEPGPLLFGRRTYEQFHSFWPHQTDNPFTTSSTERRSTSPPAPSPFRSPGELRPPRGRCRGRGRHAQGGAGQGHRDPWQRRARRAR